MDDKQDFLNKINQDKSNNFPFADRRLLDNVYNKVVNKMFRINENPPSTGGQPVQNKAQRVINADKAARAAMQELILSLSDLKDREIALKIISDHIFFLNDIFKDFESSGQQSQPGENKEQK